MPHLIQHQHPERREGKLGWTANISTAATPMAAVQWAAKCYTWAQGWPDEAAGIIWPFNPDMLVDGRRACEVAAEEWGGAWAEALARREGVPVRELAA